MKRKYFLKLFCFCLLIFSLISFLKAVCDDEESSFNALGESSELFYDYRHLAAAINHLGSALWEQCYDLRGLEPFILYLERQEKSPPPKNFA